MKNLVKSTIVCLFIFIVFLLLISVGLKKSEVVLCNKLIKQNQDFRHFYVTVEEDEMCKAHGIDIGAPVYKE